MIKIKVNLFESILAAIFLPNLGFVCLTLFLICSLIFGQESSDYTGILIAYISCLLLMILSLIICFVVNAMSSKVFILNNDEFEYLNRKYQTNEIRYCTYYECKWYTVPIAIIYKQQRAGLIRFKLNSGQKILFRIFYRDYLKLKNSLPNIIVK